MNGGWHDAGDLSQGLVNTGEATYAMFALAGGASAAGRDPEWLPLLEDEARWGLESGSQGPLSRRLPSRLR